MGALTPELRIEEKAPDPKPDLASPALSQEEQEGR